jgi:Tol biopolymer transport system component
MDQHQRRSQNQSFFSVKKNLAVAGACLGFLFVACKSVAPAIPGLQPPQDYLLIKGVKQITFEGQNDSPQFSNDGTRMLFVSRSRLHHKNTQIYEMNLQRNKERRITFQDGQVRNPIYISDNSIIYASNTDEIKENLTEDGVIADVKDYPPLDLYESDLYGNDIERLTHSAGYDDEPNYIPEPRPHLLFTSKRNENLGIFKYDFKTKATTPVLFEKGKDRWSPAISNSPRQMVWLEKDSGKQKTRIMMAALKDLKPKVLKDEEHEFADLHFIPNSTQIIYSVKRKGQVLFQIEAYDYEKKCTQVVFSGADSLIQPAIDRTGTNIAFTRVINETRQVYMVELPKNFGPCIESVP